MNGAPWADVPTAAVGYAELELAIFQLHEIRADGRCACANSSCDDVGKHPVGKGWQKTTPSRDFAAREWGRFPKRGIGMATGPRSRCFGLDIDPRHGGGASLERLVAAHGKLPLTWTAQTGGGGWHLLFAWPADLEVRNSVGKVAAGIDVRGVGGYLVLPPSAHRTGDRYRWIHPPDKTPLAPAPSWLLELVANGGAQPRARRARVPAAMIPAGKRHAALVSLLKVMRRWGACEEVLDAAAIAFVTKQCLDDDPTRPIDMGHVHRTAEHIARRY